MWSSNYSDFSLFSRDLFIHNVAYPYVFNHFYVRWDRLDLCDAIPIINDMVWLCMCFTDTYRQNFLKVFIKVIYDDFRTEEQFFRYIIPRCFEIIVPEFYFYSMVLVSAFIREFLEFMDRNRLCYRFHMVAHKCYTAVFKRAFESSFESHGGFKGLEKYLEEFVRNYRKDTAFGHMFSDKLDLRDGDYPPGVISMIEDCCSVYDDFVLNEFELSSLGVDRVDEVLDEDSNNEDPNDEDPLRFQWPVNLELMQRTLEMERAEWSDSSPVEEYTDLSRYVELLMAEVEDEFFDINWNYLTEKLKIRMCPCCGVRCCLFSGVLFGRQLDLSLKRTPRLMKVVLKIIRKIKHKSKINWLFDFSRFHWRRAAAAAIPYFYSLIEVLVVR